MSGIRILATMLAVCVALGAPMRVTAQCRLCSTPTTTREEATANDDIRLELETNLNFDRLIIFGDGQGSATIRPDGSSTATGSVSSVGPRAMVGTVVVRGQPGRLLRVDLPRRIELFSLSGGRISFDDVASDLPSVPRLDSAGTLTFRFGGRITITGNGEGQYRGDMPITVDYL